MPLSHLRGSIQAAVLCGLIFLSAEGCGCLAEGRGRFTFGHWRTQSGGEFGGFNPPIESSKKFVLCFCKIYSPSPALIFIKSKILYRKTLKNVHQFHILLQVLGDFVPQTPYRGFAPGSHWGTSVPHTPWPGHPPREPPPL